MAKTASGIQNATHRQVVGIGGVGLVHSGVWRQGPDAEVERHQQDQLKFGTNNLRSADTLRTTRAL